MGPRGTRQNISECNEIILNEIFKGLQGFLGIEGPRGPKGEPGKMGNYI